MNNQQEVFMNEAARLSRQYMEQGAGGPFGCVIVKDGEIVGRGWNSVLADNDPTAHAEIMAIRDACNTLKHFQLTGCYVYTTCEPCPMCMGALYWARPEKVFYVNTRQDAADIGFDDSFIYEELKLPVTQRIIPMVVVDNETAKEAFRLWTEKKDKKAY